MRWWGVDETLLELFARHLQAANFVGNPMDRFRAVINGRAHGPNQTPRSIGLYGGRYTIEFRPGKSDSVSVAVQRWKLTCIAYARRCGLFLPREPQRVAGGRVDGRRLGDDGGGVRGESFSPPSVAPGAGWPILPDPARRGWICSQRDAVLLAAPAASCVGVLWSKSTCDGSRVVEMIVIVKLKSVLTRNCNGGSLLMLSR